MRPMWHLFLAVVAFGVATFVLLVGWILWFVNQ
jgi:hypothetical protein